MMILETSRLSLHEFLHFPLICAITDPDNEASVNVLSGICPGIVKPVIDWWQTL